MTDSPSLIIGLGNPGKEHERDRHNVGYWLVDALASAAAAGFSMEQKILGETVKISISQSPVRLLKPATYMNRSGESMRRAIDYYKIAPEKVLVVHDDLDLPPGVARLKRGGGHGGHNGLRDIINHCGREFMRLRIGIGHPGRKEQVSGYVLHPPGKEDLIHIEDALRAAQVGIDVLYAEGLERAMNRLHTATARDDVTKDLGPAG
jgi:PTH1 family peptidyl-tRNA hydrolase